MLDKPHLFPGSPFELYTLNDLRNISIGIEGMLSYGIFITLQIPGLLIYPHETLFELILYGPTFGNF